MTAMLRTLFKIFDTILGLIFGLWIPVVASIIFCLATGIGFLDFWGAVYKGLHECAVLYLSWLAPSNWGNIQHWIRYMIF